LQIGRHGTQAVAAGEALIIGSGSGKRGGGPELTSFEVLSASGVAKFEISVLRNAELEVSAKEIDFSKNSEQQNITIMNHGETAIVIPYLQLDNQEDFSLSELPKSPLILAPGSALKISLEKVGSKDNVSATLFLKSAGDAAPIEVKISA
jgi:hypothetical protein